jgi:hypothetical protein
MHKQAEMKNPLNEFQNVKNPQWISHLVRGMNKFRRTM